MSKTGIMICGHGSRAKSAEEEFALLAKGLRARYPDMPVEYGFLEYSAPNIHMGLNALRDAGVTEFLVKPFNARDLYRRIVQIIERPRQFVRSEDFFGPDRRRKRESNYAGPRRREEDDRNQNNSAQQVAEKLK